MIYPRDIISSSTTEQGGCKSLGRSETIWGDFPWGAGKEKPYTGEDFG